MNDYPGGGSNGRDPREGRKPINRVELGGAGRDGEPRRQAQRAGSYSPQPVRERQNAERRYEERRHADQRTQQHRPVSRQTQQDQRRAPQKNAGFRLKGWAVAAIDIVAIGAFLIVFALFHHVIPIKADMEPVKLPNSAVTEPSAAPAPPSNPDDQSGTADPAEPAVSDDPETSEPVTPAGHKFEDKFTDEPVKTDTTFSNHNVNVTVTTNTEGSVTYHVADVYVRDVRFIKTAFGQDEFGRTDWVQSICAAHNGFVAINGDQSGQHREGYVVRNGELYREVPFKDVAVLENDGTLNTYPQKEFDIETVKQNGAWQVWSFGPVLLTDGQPMTKFNTDVSGANPRSAIGMIEPLHYVLVVVDGRGESKGMSMEQLSDLMYSLGCKTAYNLDGGGTAAMAVDGELYSSQSTDRKAADIIFVGMD